MAIDETKPIGELLREHANEPWGSEVEIERARRIKVAAWAYAYEIESDSIVDDATFDREAQLIRPEMPTGHAEMDAFFRTEFSPHTGMWVHKHPHFAKLKQMAAMRRQGAARKT